MQSISVLSPLEPLSCNDLLPAMVYFCVFMLANASICHAGQMPAWQMQAFVNACICQQMQAFSLLAN
jgi:hypothetical protein